MKVCHVVTAFARDEKDQFITPWMVSLLKELKNHDVENVVFAPAWKGLKENVYQGIKVKRFRYFFKRYEVFSHDNSFPSQVKKSILYAPLAFFVLFWGMLSLRRFVIREKFDIVNIHWPLPLSIMTFLLPRKTTLVYSYYSAEIVFFKKLSTPMRLFFRFFIKKAKLHKVNSSYTKEIFQANFPGFDVSIVPDCHEFPEEFHKPHYPEKGPYEILFVGRFVQRKGIEYLLRAMPLILENIDVRLTLIGNGVLFDSLREQSEKLGLSDKVVFRGFVTHEEKVRTYLDSDLFVLPACFDDTDDTEGLGMVLVEALSYACPVVASKVGGIVDIVTDGETGLLVEEKSPASIADAVVRMLSDKELYLRIAEKGAEYVREKFDSRNIADNIFRLYKSLI